MVLNGFMREKHIGEGDNTPRLINSRDRHYLRLTAGIDSLDNKNKNKNKDFSPRKINYYHEQFSSGE